MSRRRIDYLFSKMIIARIIVPTCDRCDHTGSAPYGPHVLRENSKENWVWVVLLRSEG
jgi:hypothetical protein